MPFPVPVPHTLPYEKKKRRLHEAVSHFGTAIFSGGWLFHPLQRASFSQYKEQKPSSLPPVSVPTLLHLFTARHTQTDGFLGPRPAGLEFRPCEAAHRPPAQYSTVTSRKLSRSLPSTSAAFDNPYPRSYPLVSTITGTERPTPALQPDTVVAIPEPYWVPGSFKLRGGPGKWMSH
ncbi:hypothetical protein BN1708_008010 [Verticillium longisporum]|uniref:Uncharacterized protein n=1 Tax=Verticillium longisporum TaxID=100787 RepID=A0A0G4N042_VERLO|nr:hypothetical protein BN1708_008010 [Verticillium longisporum]